MFSSDLVMVAYHDYRLVALSVVISVLGAYAARALVQRIREARSWAWLAWLVPGAIVDGIGTWSMHYTGKLALRLPVPLLLDWPTVLLSLLVGIIGSAGALILLSRRPLGWFRALAAGIFLGAVGVAGLHFTAMAAIRVPHVHHHILALAALSTLLAIVASLMAIALAFLFGGDTPVRSLKYHESTWLRGLANPLMHYTAMAGVIFTYPIVAPDLSHAVSIATLGILGISVVPIMLLVVLLLTSLVDRLRSQKEILQKIFDHIPVMISFFDKEGRIKLVNREWERKRGWSLKDVQELDSDVLAHIYPDPKELQRARDFIAAASGEWGDFRSIGRDGQVMDTAWANVRLSDGTSLSIGQDVTLRLRTEESLRESEERFRQFAENLQDVIWMVDSKVERLLYINPAYETVWGLQRENIYRNMHAFMEPVHPDDRHVVLEMLKEQKKAKLVTAEYRIIRPDGAVRWIRNRSFPVRNSEGEVYRIAGVAEDITEKKQAEEQLKATSEQLRALSARLQSAREEEGTRIAREIHDELGGALTSLRWDLESFDDVITELTDQSQIQLLRAKIKAMLSLAETTISAVRRISSELRPGVLDDLGLVEAIEWQARQFQNRTGILVKFECTLENVDLSREQSTAIFRILQEALTNILRHAQATRVEICFKEEAGEVVLTVSDNGRGITEEDKSRLQSLGLLGMLERAHLIGGEVNITGVEGQGTVVKVRVPIS